MRQRWKEVAADVAILQQLHPSAKVRKSDAHPPFKHIKELTPEDVSLNVPLNFLDRVIHARDSSIRFKTCLDRSVGLDATSRIASAT